MPAGRTRVPPAVVTERLASSAPLLRILRALPVLAGAVAEESPVRSQVFQVRRKESRSGRRSRRLGRQGASEHGAISRLRGPLFGAGSLGQSEHPGQADLRGEQHEAEQQGEEEAGVAQGEGGRAQCGASGDGPVKAMVMPVAVRGWTGPTTLDAGDAGTVMTAGRDGALVRRRRSPVAPGRPRWTGDGWC